MLVGVLLLIDTLEYFGLVLEGLSILTGFLVSIEGSFNRDDVFAKGMMAGFYFSSVNLTKTALLGEYIRSATLALQISISRIFINISTSQTAVKSITSSKLSKLDFFQRLVTPRFIMSRSSATSPASVTQTLPVSNLILGKLMDELRGKYPDSSEFACSVSVYNSMRDDR